MRRTLAEKVEPQTTTRRLTCGRITLRTSPLTVVGEMGTVRPPSPEAAVAASRKDALSRESAVVRPLTTSGRAGVAVDKPAEESSTSPDGVPALSVAFDPVSAGAGSLGGGAESVVPSTASELLPRFEGRLLAAAADAGEKPGAAGNALVAPVSTAPLPPPASGAVPSASGVAVGSVPVAAGSAGVGVHPAACGAAPEPVAGVGSEGVGVHAVAGGAVPGAVVVVVASVALEVVSGGAGAGTSVPGSVAVVSVPSVTAGSVSAAPVAAGEVSASGAVAELLGVPEGSGGARSSARAVLTQIDAQASATSSAAVPPRTRSHRWSASKATRFGTKSAPLAMATVVLRARDYLQSTRLVQGGMRS